MVCQGLPAHHVLSSHVRDHYLPWTLNALQLTRYKGRVCDKTSW